MGTGLGLNRPDPFRVPDESLAACASEPIHTPGSIQPHGMLLAFAPDFTIEQAGGPDLLGRPTSSLPGTRLADVLPSALLDGLQAATSTGRAARDLGIFTVRGRRLEATMHRHDGIRLLELIEPGVRAPGVLGEVDAGAVVAGLLDTLARRDEDLADFDLVAQEIVSQFCAFSGYDRVMLYRFDAAWNGEVIAEASTDGTARFAGLHFPAADIPPQARDLYLRARLRVLADARATPLPLHPQSHPATGRPLDLSLAQLRSLSPVHREYLANMGVRGTLVASVVVDRRLWGLLTCHHAEPRVPDAPTRVLALGLASVITQLVHAHEQRQRALGEQWAQALLSALRQRILSADDLSDTLVAPEARFLEVVDADGLIVATPAGLRARGAVPERAVLGALVDWLDEHVDTFFVTDHAAGAIPSVDLGLTACGVLALRIPGFARGWIIWTREESRRTVQWGGDPRKGVVEVGGATRLSPRTSFEAWLETVQGCSRPWSLAERALASEAVRSNLLDVVVAWQRRQAEAMEARYATLLAKVHDAIIVLDRDGLVTFWNAGATGLLGWRAEERLRQPLGECVAPLEWPALRARVARVREGERFADEIQCLRRDGTPIWLDVQIDPVVDDDGVSPAYVIIARDASRRRELEAQLRQAAKMEAVGALAGGIAHDFNNLLTVVTGFSSLLLKSLPDDAPERWMIEEIASVGQRGTALTRQMLAFSRRQLLQPETFDLNAAVSASTRMLERLIGEDVRLVLELCDRPCPVHVDPGQLDQVLLNLAVNARDAMPGGGRLTFATAVVDHAGGAVPGLALLPAGAWVRLSVHDTGVGMAAETLGKIFEPFFTTKEPGKGTGLGLAVVYGVVNQSHGCVAVESAPGRGTSFHLYLPLSTHGASAAHEAAPEPALSSLGETILVLEDEPGVRSLTCVLLRQQGYRVLEAGHPAEALELAATLEHLDLLLTDIVMPEMPGPEVAARLSARLPGIRVLFMSGYPGDEMVRRGVVAEGIELLHKPFSPATLLARIRTVLDGRSSMRP